MTIGSGQTDCGTAASAGAVAAALAQASSFGPFFAVQTVAGGDGWELMSSLIDADDPSRLDARIAETRAALAGAVGVSVQEVERRVAASLAQLNLSARLLAPVLGCVVVADVVPDFGLSRLWWRPVLGGPAPLAFPGPSGRVGADIRTAVSLVVDLVIQGAIAPLAQRFQSSVAVSPLVLRGNVASAIVTATQMIAEGAPELAGKARLLAAGLLRTPWLAGTFDLDEGRRRSCCLYYRAYRAANQPTPSEALICGDCVLGG